MNPMIKEQLQSRYGQLCIDDIMGVDLAFSIQLDNLLAFAQKLEKELSPLSFLDIIASVEENNSEYFEITYLMLSMQHQLLFAIRTRVGIREVLPTLTEIFPHCAYLEHEVFDLYGVNFSRPYTAGLYKHYLMEQFPLMEQPSAFNYLSLADADRFPALIQQKKETEVIVNLGPVHPLFQSGIRFLARLDDQKITGLELELGQLHKGVEHSMSQMPMAQLTHLGSLMGLSFADSLNCAIAMGLEQAYGLSISKKAEVVRVFVLELDRLAEHLNLFIRLAQQFHALPLLSQCLEAREFLADFMGKVCGKRIGGGTIRLGGSIDIFAHLSVHEFFLAVESLHRKVDKIEKLFCSKSSWKDILGDDCISRRFALTHQLAGPNLRASGVNWDWRKRRPYYFYNDLDFNIPCGVEGSSYDRFNICLMEMRESLHILTQLLDSIPSGHTESMLSKQEMTSKCKCRAVYVRIEGPRGELSVFLRFNKQGKYVGGKISPSTRSAAFALPSLIVGKNLDQFSSLYLSLGINPTEVDR